MLRARDDKAKDTRKQHILDCAEQIIGQEGLNSLSIAGVAKSAKLAVGTIYLYFPKKEDIIAHLTIKSREMLLQKFEESTANIHNALDQLRNLLSAYIAFYKQHAFYHQLVSFYETNAGLDEPKELLQASKNITDLVVAILQKGKQQGCIRAEIDEQEFSFLLWGTAVGIIQLINVKSTILQAQLNKSSDQFYESYIELIITSIKIN
jgi:TetR/AcrR family fatty acid metabolism transcriptional regulator